MISKIMTLRRETWDFAQKIVNKLYYAFSSSTQEKPRAHQRDYPKQISFSEIEIGDIIDLSSHESKYWRVVNAQSNGPKIPMDIEIKPCDEHGQLHTPFAISSKEESDKVVLFAEDHKDTLFTISSNTGHESPYVAHIGATNRNNKSPK
jgi:hypothetical protein